MERPTPSPVQGEGLLTHSLSLDNVSSPDSAALHSCTSTPSEIRESLEARSTLVRASGVTEAVQSGGREKGGGGGGSLLWRLQRGSERTWSDTWRETDWESKGEFEPGSVSPEREEAGVSTSNWLEELPLMRAQVPHKVLLKRE